VLHGKCAGRPEDGGNPPERVGDVEAEEELQLGGALTTPVVPDDRRHTLQVRGREGGE
jgi:hypothetical protein